MFIILAVIVAIVSWKTGTSILSGIGEIVDAHNKKAPALDLMAQNNNLTTPLDI